MAHPEAEAVGSDAGSDYTVFGKFLDAPQATAEDLSETPEQGYEDSGQPDDAAQAAESEETEGTEPDDGHQSEAIEPPLSWSKADKEYFQSLPPETQRVVADRERQRDTFLTQRAEALANERKTFEAQIAEAEKAKQSYLANVERLKTLVPELPKAPDESILETDPMEYMRQRHAYERAQEQAKAIDSERARIAQEHQQQEAAAYQSFVKEQALELEKLIPEYRDETTRPQFQKDVAEYALKQGYTPQQLQWASAHDIVTLNKARLYDAMQSASKAVPEKLKDVPKVSKPGQRLTPAEVQASKYREKMDRLRKTGSVDDAAAFFKDIL